MRADILTMVALLTVSTAAQQRGAVSGVSVHKATVQTGVPVEITITGANPCGAVRVDPGDDTERVTYPITQVPTTVRHVYQKTGQFKETVASAKEQSKQVAYATARRVSQGALFGALALIFGALTSFFAGRGSAVDPTVTRTAPMPLTPVPADAQFNCPGFARASAMSS